MNAHDSGTAPEPMLWSRIQIRCKSGGAGAGVGADGSQIFGAGAIFFGSDLPEPEPAACGALLQIP